MICSRILLLPAALLFVSSAHASTDQDPLTLQKTTPSPQNAAPVLQDIHDIYPPLPLAEPINWLVILPILAAALAAAALVFFWLRNKKQQTAPVIPPHMAALADLAQARSYISEGQSLAYAERASEILRTYIEKRFDISSTRQTTSEFLEAMRAQSSDLTQHREVLEEFLEQCDMGKYARKTSARKSMERMEEGIRQFIERTIPEPEVKN